MIEKEYEITTQVLNFQSDRYETYYHKPNLVEIEDAIYSTKAGEQLPESLIKEIVVEHYDALDIKKNAVSQAEERHDRSFKIWGKVTLLVFCGVAFNFSEVFTAKNLDAGIVWLLLNVPMTLLLWISAPFFNPFVLRAESKINQAKQALRDANTPTLKAKLEAKVREFTRRNKQQEQLKSQQADQPLEEKIAHKL